MKDEEKQNKNTTQYALDTTIGKQTKNIVNKTWVLLQTIGSNEERTSFFMRKS